MPLVQILIDTDSSESDTIVCLQQIATAIGGDGRPTEGRAEAAAEPSMIRLAGEVRIKAYAIRDMVGHLANALGVELSTPGPQVPQSGSLARVMGSRSFQP
jgi:hypothetical protein